MTGGSELNPIAKRALRSSLRPKSVLGLVSAALLVLAAAGGLAPDPDSMPGLRVRPGYVGLCRAELIALLAFVTITAAASIASERQERTWDALVQTALSDTELVLGKAAGVLPSATLLALLLVPAHLVYGIAWGVPWGIIISIQVVFLGAAIGAAGLGLLGSSACGRVLHAVALAAAAIIFGWFAALDGLASGWVATRLARVGHPLRLLDDLVASPLSADAALVRVLAFLLGSGLGGGLTFLATIRLARRPVEGTVLALPGIFRLRPGKTERVWDDPVYWRECRSRGARRALRIGGLLLMGLAVVLTITMRDPAKGGLWAQVFDLLPNYETFLIRAGMLLLCLRASVTIVDERRRGMLAPLALAGVSPARLGWSKLKGALRPAVPLTAMVVIFWVSFMGTVTRGFTDSRLWLDGLGVLAVVGSGYFLAVSLGLLASAFAPSLRVALLAAPALLIAWDAAPQFAPQVLEAVWPGISRDTLRWLFNVIGGDPLPVLGRLRLHVARFEVDDPVTWVVWWVAVETLAGLTAWIAAVFWVSRGEGNRKPPR